MTGRPPLPQPGELEDVAVFPLPKLVLFPGATLPLHFFEPRYRKMMDDIVAGGRTLLAVAQLVPGWQDDYGDRPAMQPVLGLGRIVRQRRNGDGTHDVVLEGIARVRVEERDGHALPYRHGALTLLEDVEPPGGLAQPDLAALLSLASQVVQCVRKNQSGFRLLADASDQMTAPGLFVDQIADQLVPDADMRQEVLETLDLGKRIRLVSASVAKLHLALLASERDDEGGSGSSGGGRVLH